MKRICTLASGLALCVLVSPLALAHARLVSADPPVNGAAKTPPHSIDLHFSEEISGKLSGVTVRGADGRILSTMTMLSKDGKQLTVMLKQPLGAGTYMVEWHAVASDDGHRTSGTYKITVS